MNLRKAPRTLVLTAGYAALVHAAVAVSLLLRHDGAVPADALALWARLAPAYTVLSLLGYLWAGLYHGLWRYAGTATVFQIVRGVSFSAAVWGLGLALAGHDRFPLGAALQVGMAQLVMMGGVRLAWRLWRERVLGGSGARAVPALVVGADDAAVGLVQEMRRKQSGDESLQPLGFVDPDPRLTGHLVEGLKVFGTLADLSRVLAEQRPAVVVVANPELPGRAVRDIATACTAAGVRLRTVPAMSGCRPEPASRWRGFAMSGSRTCSAREPVPQAERRRRRVPARPPRAGHRRRRLDRLGAVPPGRPLRPAAAGPARSAARTRSSTSSASCAGRCRRRRPLGRSSPTCATRPRSSGSSRAQRPARGVPRRRAQARAADGGAPRRGGQEQRRRHAAAWPTPPTSTASSAS